MGGSHMFKVGVYFGSEGGFGECRIYRCLRGLYSGMGGGGGGV